MKIVDVRARQVLDSRGNPTVEADVYLENHIIGRAIVPSGASTGIHEAVELRDGDNAKYNGLGVLKAVKNVNTEIANAVIGMETDDQEGIDEKLIDLDGTENKSRLGANAILSVSIAAAKAAAMSRNLPLYAYFNELASNNVILGSETTPESDPGQARMTNFSLPIPLMNIINGGKHAASSTDIQEFLIVPIGAPTFSEALRMGAEIFHALAKVLTENGYGTTVGDEGGFAPHVRNGNKEALDLICKAVEKAHYQLGTDVGLAFDAAASEFYKDGKYSLKAENKELTSEEMIDWYQQLVKEYPIISIEDGLSESDWDGWKKLNEKMGKDTQIIGDDIFVTNTKFLKRGIDENSANAVLIKVNQIGTLTETIQAVQMAEKAGWNSIISHRSGETEDTTIAHIAVALATGQIKTGSLSRTERIAKYNELLRIEEGLGKDAQFAKFIHHKS